MAIGGGPVGGAPIGGRDQEGGGGSQTITQTATFANSNTFYAASINHHIDASLFTSSNTFATASVNHRIPQDTSAINTATFHAGQINHAITAALFENANTVHSGQINLTVYAGTVANDNTFHSGGVGLTVAASLFEDGDTFYSGLTTSHQGRLPGGFIPRPIKYIRDVRNDVQAEPAPEPQEEPFDRDEFAAIAHGLITADMAEIVRQIQDAALSAAAQLDAREAGQRYIEQMARDEEDALLALVLAA